MQHVVTGNVWAGCRRRSSKFSICHCLFLSHHITHSGFLIELPHCIIQLSSQLTARFWLSRLVLMSFATKFRKSWGHRHHYSSSWMSVQSNRWMCYIYTCMIFLFVIEKFSLSREKSLHRMPSFHHPTSSYLSAGLLSL